MNTRASVLTIITFYKHLQGLGILCLQILTSGPNPAKPLNLSSINELNLCQWDWLISLNLSMYLSALLDQSLACSSRWLPYKWEVSIKQNYLTDV